MREGESGESLALESEAPKPKNQPMEDVMLNERSKREAMSATPALRWLAPFISAALLTMVWTNSFAKDDHHPGDNRFTSYNQINLVSDQPGVALLQDTNLVNAWGVSFSPTSPFWVSDNGTGKSTLYSVTNDASGSPQVTKLGLEVSIPGEGNPSGQEFNNTTNFHADPFIFVSAEAARSWPLKGTAIDQRQALSLPFPSRPRWSRDASQAV